MFYRGDVSRLVSTKQRTECCTMKNGVSLGIVAPLYSIGLILCRVKDMFRVDQYRRTSCKGTMLRQALNEKRRTIAHFHKRSHELALFVIQALMPWIFSSVCGHNLFISSFLDVLSLRRGQVRHCHIYVAWEGVEPGSHHGQRDSFEFVCHQLAVPRHNIVK